LWFLLFMKNIRRRIINDIEGSPLKQRAVAFALLLKELTKDSSVIHNYTVNKVCQMTRVECQKNKKNRRGFTMMHAKTVSKYVDVLIKMGLVYIDGKGNLFLKKMASDNKHRNLNISKFMIDKTKNIYNQIRDLIFLLVQAQKDFINSLLRLRKEPTPDVDLKKVRRLCKKCCDDPNAEYKEYGVSYRRIARSVGCCARTAVNVVNDAIKRNWCTKTNNCERIPIQGANFDELPGFTFLSRGYGYIIRSNTYTLARAWSSALVADASRVCAKRYGIL